MPDAKLCSIPDCGNPSEKRGWCNTHYLRWRKHGNPEKLVRTSGKTAMEWLEKTALIYEGDECLTWPFGRDAYGRAKIDVSGRWAFASRIVCELTHGKAPSNKHHAAHSCGNGHLACVNPRHMRWATVSENQKDRIKHGTSNRGERCGTSRLKASNVRKIRRLAKVMEQQDIARMFDVSKSTVSQIINRKSWAWLD